MLSLLKPFPVRESELVLAEVGCSHTQAENMQIVTKKNGKNKVVSGAKMKQQASSGVSEQT